jgi:hypothetical protein
VLRDVDSASRRSRDAGTPPLSAHVDFTGALFIVGGILTVIVGVSTLLLGVGAAALARTAAGGEGRRVAAGLAAVVLAVLALIAILWGVAHVAVGLPLRRHRAWARLAALMIGTVDLLLFPFGTVLGAYALWALLGEDRRALFTPSSAASSR